MGSKTHPLDPLTQDEISLAVRLVKEAHPGLQLKFRVVTLEEPPKNELVPYLERQTTTDRRILRIAHIQVYIDHKFYAITADLDGGKLTSTRALPGRHAYIDADYMEEVGNACLADAKVQAAIKDLDLPDTATVVVEPWAYATDGLNDMSARISMCWFYMRLSEHPDSNYYAHPLDICAEVSEGLIVTKLYRLPNSETASIEQSFQKHNIEKMRSTSEYHPDLYNERRNTTRPLHISQPEGPSFQCDGNFLSWEKWSMRIGFNYREGMTLHDIRYDGRSLFYRLSLSEMFVPYGDSRIPYPRKAAFDLGNDGAGVNANDLRLGCDCIGHIKYFDGWLVTNDGLPLRKPNAICCHEIDDGIMWKHTNFRTNNAVVARSRVLVLQSIITVSNYEYVFSFNFTQDAAITYEIRATGILSTVPIDIGERFHSGTIVAPGVLAPDHQHLFCLRIDPAIGGHRNSVAIEESRLLPVAEKPGHTCGVGFATQFTLIEEESAHDLDYHRNRVFKIVNENEENPITMTPIGYKLIPFYSQTLIADPSTFHAKRSEFAAHAIWITRYSDNEKYPAGHFTMQSQGGEGIASWIKGRRSGPESSRSTRNQDIVLWHCFGSTHHPRIEDWPVMPCEKLSVTLKPVNFFSHNPSLDLDIAKPNKSNSKQV